MERLKKLNTDTKIDAFVCQLSTNDIRIDGLKKLGSINVSQNRKDFDTSTTIGAIQYIISYARETWKCPVVFVTSANFGNSNYEVLLRELYKIKDKSDIEIIDLYNNKKLNTVSSDSLKLCISNDHIHPHKAGYKLWWTPVIEKQLYNIIGTTSWKKN